MRSRRTCVIGSCVAALISVFMTSSPVEAIRAGDPDRTGLDILCDAAGGIYNKTGRYSICVFPDGTVLVCDSATDKCTKTTVITGEPPNPNPNAVSVSGLVNLQANVITINRLNDLAGQLSDLATQVRNLEAACTSPDLR